MSTEQLLQDKVVIVTGGSRGIGRAIVLELSRRGAHVLFSYASNRDAAQEVVRLTESSGNPAVMFQADIRKYDQAQSLIKAAIEKFSRLDGLVNNAGITRDKALMNMEPSDWHDVLDTNLTGTFHCCRAAIVTMLKQKSGRIVNVSSVAGLVGLARQVNYSASKAGIIGLTKALAKEVAVYGVTVNAIAPGYIDSDMTKAIPETRIAELRKAIPLGRFGKADEVAGLVAVLLSGLASYVTGQTVVVDGGLSA